MQANQITGLKLTPKFCDTISVSKSGRAAGVAAGEAVRLSLRRLFERALPGFLWLFSPLRFYCPQQWFSATSNRTVPLKSTKQGRELRLVPKPLLQNSYGDRHYANHNILSPTDGAGRHFPAASATCHVHQHPAGLSDNDARSCHVPAVNAHFVIRIRSSAGHKAHVDSCCPDSSDPSRQHLERRLEKEFFQMRSSFASVHFQCRLRPSEPVYRIHT